VLERNQENERFKSLSFSLILMNSGEKKDLPPIMLKNTIFIPSRDNPSRKSISNYVSSALYKLLGGQDVVYISGAGIATKDVADVVAILERCKLDIKVVYGGIENLRRPKVAKELGNGLTIGLTQKNHYEPKFESIE